LPETAWFLFSVDVYIHGKIADFILVMTCQHITEQTVVKYKLCIKESLFQKANTEYLIVVIISCFAIGTAIAVVLCVALLMGLIVLIIGAVGLLARR